MIHHTLSFLSEDRKQIMPSKNLPEELILDILSRLPVKSLLRFRCVSKPWCILITDPSFIKMHLNRSLATNTNLTLIYRNSIDFYSVDLDAWEFNHPLKSQFFRPTRLLGSCNGLLCILNCEDDTFLWNPSTTMHQKLPLIPIDHTLYDYAYGFGYDPITDDYKVLRVVGFHSNDHSWHSKVMVYSLRNNSWRRIEDMQFPSISLEWMRGLLVNSALHWVTEDWTGHGFLVSFDLTDEEYREMPLPDIVDYDFVDDKFLMKVGVLGGQLCLVCSFSFRVEIWVMKDYGVRESWVKMFSNEEHFVIWQFYYLTPVCYSKNGEFILRRGGRCGSLILYDPHRGMASNLRNYCPDDIEICVGSLVPINMPKMELNKKKMEEKETKGII
ncbi:F-box protein CPR1-like [Macadamia integrifolia]|uniref:F-box protein CPR1-like n=1 Tax=Macadamia integrifolia TaxID=60698 RepID=UPI001C4E69D2|nr:F-box protein CPR1-like [Macadamia integrifolia]